MDFLAQICLKYLSWVKRQSLKAILEMRPIYASSWGKCTFQYQLCHALCHKNSPCFKMFKSQKLAWKMLIRSNATYCFIIHQTTDPPAKLGSNTQFHLQHGVPAVLVFVSILAAPLVDWKYSFKVGRRSILTRQFVPSRTGFFKNVFGDFEDL